MSFTCLAMEPTQGATHISEILFIKADSCANNIYFCNSRQNIRLQKVEHNLLAPDLMSEHRRIWQFFPLSSQLCISVSDTEQRKNQCIHSYEPKRKLVYNTEGKELMHSLQHRYLYQACWYPQISVELIPHTPKKHWFQRFRHSFQLFQALCETKKLDYSESMGSLGIIHNIFDRLLERVEAHLESWVMLQNTAGYIMSTHRCYIGMTPYYIAVEGGGGLYSWSESSVIQLGAAIQHVFKQHDDVLYSVIKLLQTLL